MMKREMTGGGHMPEMEVKDKIETEFHRQRGFPKHDRCDGLKPQVEKRYNTVLPIIFSLVPEPQQIWRKPSDFRSKQ